MRIQDFDPNRSSSYELNIPDELVDELANTFEIFTQEYFINEPFITFEIDKTLLELNILIDNSQADILVATAVFNHFGLDIIIQTAAKNITIFNIFGLDKKLKFNFKNFINNFKSKNIAKKINNIEINYNECCQISLNQNTYKGCLFKIYIEQALSQELMDFYNLFKKLDISSLQKYNNLKIYLNKPKSIIEENIIFDIEHLDKSQLENLKLNFISNRLFYINNHKNLIANNFYFSTTPEIKLNCETTGQAICFNKNDSVIKLPEGIVLSGL